MPHKPRANAGRAAKNPRSSGSAAAFAGVIGLPEPGLYVRGEGSLRSFCQVFNRRFDEMSETTHPEHRSFARAERYFAATLR